MPPPNITGILHMGHAYFVTLQDILARFRRMRGDAVLWLPGTDHAGLATQSRLDALMMERGLDPSGPGFGAFAGGYRDALQATITGQIRRLGASCDWSRERFTLDDRYSRSVTEALRRCHGAGMLSHRDGQWWLDMSRLAAELLARLDGGDIRIMPLPGEKHLREWLRHIEPWCISRQIRWGHRMPVWRLPEGGITISDACPTPGATREADVLDTWFSSALWPFATLGWPDATVDFERFYPADIIETGADIIFFWCARMLMMGLLLIGTLPFRTIYLHGLILDRNGRKMSKSEGNGIDPLGLVGQWGADALRIALASDTTPGQDMRFDPERIRISRAVCTKLWNAARFTLGHRERMGCPPVQMPQPAAADDTRILADFRLASAEAAEALTACDFRRYADGTVRFLRERLCSGYIEAAKGRLRADDEQALHTLMWTLDGTLRLLHPMAPFITERIRMAYGGTPLMTDSWPY